MYDEIETILTKHGYSQVTLNISGLHFHISGEGEHYYAVVTIDETGGAVFDRNQLLHISQQFREYLIEKNYRNTSFLYLLLTDSEEAAHRLFAEDDCYWVLMPATRKFLVFENWHPYFTPLRRALEQLTEQGAASSDRGGTFAGRTSSTPYHRLSSFTTVLVLMNAVIFLLTDLTEFWGDSDYIMEWGAESWTAIILNHEYYRMLTSLFLHSGIDHLMNNMIVLFCIGGFLEPQTGSRRFLLIYFSSGLLASCTSIVYNMWQYTDVHSVGASGAVFGLMGSLLVVTAVLRSARQDIHLRGLLLCIFLSLCSGFYDQGVDNAAHVGGFVAGVAVTAFLYRRQLKQLFLKKGRQ